ncbi:DUF3098 domain-containing protein, partial [Bacteroides cellulosilyticus]
MLYLDLFRKDYYERKGSLSLLFTLIMFYCVVTALMVSTPTHFEPDIFSARRIKVAPVVCLVGFLLMI